MDTWLLFPNGAWSWWRWALFLAGFPIWWMVIVVTTPDPRIELLREMKREGRSEDEILDAALRMDT